MGFGSRAMSQLYGLELEMGHDGNTIRYDIVRIKMDYE